MEQNNYLRASSECLKYLRIKYGIQGSSWKVNTPKETSVIDLVEIPPEAVEPLGPYRAELFLNGDRVGILHCEALIK